MAVFTGSPTSSTQYALLAANATGAKTPPGDAGGKVQFKWFEYTHAAGTGTGEVNLVRLPPGRLRVIPHLSRLFVSDLEASSTVDLGYRAYYEPDGDLVSEDDNAFEDNRDTASADTDAAPEFGGDGSTAKPAVFNTRDGLDIFLSVDSGNILDGDTVWGWIAYVQT